MNGKLKRLVFDPSCSLYIGDRGSGKSTLMALANKTFQDRGYKVYCQYPYKGAYQIPMVQKRIKGVNKYLLDKEWLYGSNLRDSLVMIDEARTVWNARAYTAWTEQDEDFFNFIRKTNTFLILATQRYDGVDLNVRYAADYTFFIQRTSFFKNLSRVEVSRSVQCKIADNNTTIVSRGFTKGAQKVVWDIAEKPVANSFFYRKPFYNDFDSLITMDEKPEAVAVPWNDILNPPDKPYDDADMQRIQEDINDLLKL